MRAELEVHRWEGVADPGGMAAAPVRRRESLEASLGPARLGRSRDPCWQWHEDISPHHGSAHSHKIWDDTGFGH